MLHRRWNDDHRGKLRRFLEENFANGWLFREFVLRHGLFQNRFDLVVESVERCQHFVLLGIEFRQQAVAKGRIFCRFGTVHRW